MNLKSLVDTVKSFLGLIDYPVNDPGVQLIAHEPLPPTPNPCPLLNVNGFNGTSNANPGSVEAQAASVYISIIYSISQVQKLKDTPLTNWSRTQSLTVVPRAGVQFNAYYDGYSLRFFYGTHPTTGKLVYTCESSDVVTHELGHAILDSLRPDLWQTQSLEIFAFHESFGDMNAIIAALSHDSLIDYVIKETGGNMRLPNAVSRLAEEMGNAIYAQMGRSANALRNAINDFKYTAPETLPRNGDIDQLTGEPHSFSRIFTGAFYDLIVEMYEKNLNDHTPADALRIARDLAGTVLYNGVTLAPNQPRFYDSVARGMLIADGNHGSRCHAEIVKTFSSRGILQPMMNFAANEEPLDTFSKANIFAHDHGTTVRVGGVETVKLIDHVAVTLEANPLYAVDIDIPNEHYVEYDLNGLPTLHKSANREEALHSAKNCVDFLAATDQVSYVQKPEPDKEFTVVDGKLIRNFICGKHK